MSRQKNDQIPLGELLTKARLDKHMSRAQLSKETGISENSLVRYEKAGLEKEGQYPPSPKLAKLCFTLDISPLTVMFSSLSHNDYWKFKSVTSENWLMGHPEFEYMEEQWFTLVKENHKLAAALKLILGPKPKQGTVDAEMLEWTKTETRQIIKRQEAFDQRLKDAGFLDDWENISFVSPGNPQHKGPKSPSSLCDYAEFTKNGPDQKDPSRSKTPKNNTEAVDATSTRPKKGRTDEAV
jgi:transcriptional regulator with XRE-family HTH domain